MGKLALSMAVPCILKVSNKQIGMETYILDEDTKWLLIGNKGFICPELRSECEGRELERRSPEAGARVNEGQNVVLIPFPLGKLVFGGAGGQEAILNHCESTT